MHEDALNILQSSIDAIEERLRTPISMQELADAAGFSLSHYYHIFEAATGMSPGRYITYRRLLHAVYDMSRGMSAIDAALTYGFDTHAGFYKAFRKEFGCPPSRFLRTHRASRPARVNLKEKHTMTDIRTLSALLGAWGLEGESVTYIYYSNTGFRSENTFAVGSDHFVRASSALGELHRQAALTKQLHAHGLAAPIVPTLSGEDVLRSGDTDYLMMRRAAGCPVNALDLLEHPQEGAVLGEGIARLHAALRRCDTCLYAQEDYSKTMLDWAIPTARASLPAEDAAWLDAYAARAAALFPRLPVQLIHRDPNPDNILIDEGRVVGFLDFDLARVMPRIFDLCYAATGILCDAFRHADPAMRLRFFDVVRAIWAGYDAVSPLTAEEWQALPDMVLAIELTCVAAFAGSDKLAPQFEANIQMLRLLLDHMDLFSA
ncbi:MAG: phosphotransferase [Clostridia bacterium]|nr:phosphotransferase [Clostridia bacterium]